MSGPAPLTPAIAPVQPEPAHAGDPATLLAALRAARARPTSALAEAALHAAVDCLRREPRRSFWLARAAAHAAQGIGDPRLAARALRVAGAALANQGRLRGALRCYDRALERLGADAGGEDIAAIEVKRIFPLAQLGRFDDARRAADAALAVRRERSDPAGIAEIEIALGDVSFRRDAPRDALRRYAAARDALGTGGYARLRAILDCNSANCLEALHRYGAARRLFERAREHFHAAGLRQTVAQVDANRAWFALVRGRFSEALALYDLAEATFTELGDDRALGQVDLERADAYLQLGAPKDARRFAARASARLGAAGVRKERAQAVLLQTTADILAGRADDRDLLAARAEIESHGTPVGVAECDLLRATAALGRGDAAVAESLAAAAQTALDEHGRGFRGAAAILLRARAKHAGEQPEEALVLLAQAQRRIDGFESPWAVVEVERLRGLALRAAGDPVRGAAALERALAMIEQHRGAVPADELMIAFLASRAAIFAETLEALLALGRDRDAFGVSERARARDLSDLLEPANGAGSSRELRDLRVDRLREELNAAYARLHRAGAGPDAIDGERRRALRDTIAHRESELGAAFRAAGTGRSRERLSAGRSLAEVQASLDAHTTLLEYFVIGERTHAFVVTRDRCIHRELPAGTSLATAVAQRFAFHVAKFELGPDVAGRQGALLLAATRANLARADAFVAPLRDVLATRRLVIVPHGALHAIPFHALPDGDAWLADAFEICYAPSASVFVACGDRRGDSARATGRATVLALEDAAAPMIGAEARGVAAALGRRVRTYTGTDATSARLRDAALTSRVLHVATHGMFRADEPGLSSIRLADTWLNVHDVHALDVRASLVVLSACESGAAAVTAGEEPLGLVRAFLGAGAPCVLASRWRVEDAATAVFMEAFHASGGAGAAPGPADDAMSALRRAMSAVRRSRPHPYHWAAFVLVGHPGGCELTRRGRPASADRLSGQRSEKGASPWVPRS